MYIFILVSFSFYFFGRRLVLLIYLIQFVIYSVQDPTENL